MQVLETIQHVNLVRNKNYSILWPAFNTNIFNICCGLKHKLTVNVNYMSKNNTLEFSS